MKQSRTGTDPMQLVIHAGAHFTEEERLMKCLLRNKQDFSARGISVPGPGRYRRLLRDALSAMESTQPEPAAREVLIDAILDQEQADRLILSHPFLFGAPRACFRRGRLYDLAPERMAQIAQLFRNDEIDLFIGLRNPASFLPALLADSPQEDMEDLLRGCDPREVRWSQSLQAIRAAAPEITVTAWCFEDMPLIWAQIIREMAGLDHGEKIVGGFDLLSSIMSREGMARFRAYLKSHPTMSEMQKRRVMSAFLDKFALADEIEEELDVPGWTEELIDELTEIYDDDMHAVRRIPGVTLITP